jgi:uncharacterized protein involved in outer membrane biogenesis
MRVLKIAAIVLAVLLLIAFVAPFLVPVKTYIPALQTLAARRLNEPVSIGNLGFALLPLPYVTVEDIRIGAAEDVKIGRVVLHPDLWSLPDRVKKIRLVEVDGVTVDQSLLHRLAALAGGETGPASLVVQRIQVQGIELAVGGLRWKPLQAQLDLDAQGLRRAELSTEGQSLRVTLVPAGGTYGLELVGHGFTLPVQPALHFDELTAAGVLDRESLVVNDLAGRLYGGELRAKSRIGWKEGLHVEGEARLAGVELEPLIKRLGQSASLSGRLYAGGEYRLAARDASQLADSLRGRFRFEVKRGVLYNFDLANAVRSLAKQGVRGGQTQFNELAGEVILTGRAIALRNLKVASGHRGEPQAGGAGERGNERHRGSRECALGSRRYAQ